MSGDAREIAEAISELRYLTECRCDEAWTGRGLHETHCAWEYRPDVETLVAAVERVRAVLSEAAERSRVRCVHGRYRIDPCFSCDRRYKNGHLVGPFDEGLPDGDYSALEGESDARPAE